MVGNCPTSTQKDRRRAAAALKKIKKREREKKKNHHVGDVGQLSTDRGRSLLGGEGGLYPKVEMDQTNLCDHLLSNKESFHS